MLKTYSLMHHFKELWSSVDRSNFTGAIRLKDFRLAVSNGKRVIDLQPQFLVEFNDGKGYVRAPSERMTAFSGWRENPFKSWQISSEKIEFKKYISTQGLPTPDFCLNGSKRLENVIVKSSRSSFSQGIRGPYRRSDESGIDVANGEFYEKFIPGNIVKIWYWNEEPVAAELLEMLGVFGNGFSSILDLLENHRMMIGAGPVDYGVIVPFLNFQGISLATVPERGKEVKVDFRYASIFPMSYRARDVRIGREDFFGLEGLLRDVGRALWEAIPKDIRSNLVYSVDGILDSSGKLWLLEMNSNPYVHPYLYSHMLKD